VAPAVAFLEPPGARVGEVVGTTSTAFIAQTPRLHQTPPLGALVNVCDEGDLTIYGIVASASTEGVSAAARPVPRGRDGTENAAIYRANPDLEHVLRTSFECVVVGHARGGLVHYFLPPTPAPIHYSVTMCNESEVQSFTADVSYLWMVLMAEGFPVEEVIASHIRYVAEACHRTGRETPYSFTVRAGREMAALLRDDHQRLAAILQRIRRAPGS